MSEEIERDGNYLTREIPGVLSLFLAVTLFLAVISYDPSDPSLGSFSTRSEPARIHNYIGLAGSYFTGVCVDLLGLAAFWPVLVMVLISWRCFRGRSFNYSWVVVFGLFLMLLTTSAFFSMIFPRLNSFWPETPGGGLIGDLVARYLFHLLNPIGAYLLVSVLFLVSLILSTGLSLIRASGNLTGLWESARFKLESSRMKRREEAEFSSKLKLIPETTEQDQVGKIKVKKAKKSPVPLEPEDEPVHDFAEFLEPGGPYRLPLPELLDEMEKSGSGVDHETLLANARLVEQKLSDFNVTGEVMEVSTGPVVTMYEYQPAPGIKISKVAGLADDLAMNMKAEAIRVVAPLPGKAAIGIEIPNPKREFVSLKEVVTAPVFSEAKSLLTVVLGVDTLGRPEVADLAKMPHLLIAGATGSGKSVGLNAIIMSILFKAKPDQVRFMMIDPKRIELTLYKDLPHLIYPVISDPQDATQALKWAVADMENRYQLLAEKGVRNIDAYNRKILKEMKEQPSGTVRGPAVDDGPDEDDEPVRSVDQAAPLEPLPYLVLIIDELADLMMVSAKDVETSITRLAQMARAAGIHLILATQRPSVDVLTGVIKANMPTRISFQVSSKIDSRTILDTGGSEKLLGMGDMLYLPPGTSKIRRIHGAYVSEEEIKRTTDFIRAQGEPNYLESLKVEALEGEEEAGEEEYDEKYDEAVELVTRSGKASISLIQRHLRIGYNRAARIIEIMEKEGVVGAADGARPRQVLAREL